MSGILWLCKIDSVCVKIIKQQQQQKMRYSTQWKTTYDYVVLFQLNERQQHSHVNHKFPTYTILDNTTVRFPESKCKYCPQIFQIIKIHYNNCFRRNVGDFWIECHLYRNWNCFYFYFYVLLRNIEWSEPNGACLSILFQLHRSYLNDFYHDCFC